MHALRIAAVLLSLMFCVGARAAVVINEIFYHAPNDLEDLQWIELYNTGKEAIDLSGWSLARGVTFAIPAGTDIKADGYLVVARKPTLFGQHYRVKAIGGFESPLKHGASHIELLDSKGQVLDIARYKDRDPWPMSPDGYSSSLERICPTASGEKAENWAPSPLPASAPRPSGTPGARNSCYSANPPPAISKVTCTPDDPALEQPIRVEADVTDADGVREVALLYRTMTPGSAMSPEVAIAMAKTAGNRYAANIPAQNAERLMRYRIKAIDSAGIERIYPHPNDLRSTLSVWVHGVYKPGKLPFGLVMRFPGDRSVERFPGDRSVERSRYSADTAPPETDRPHSKFGPPAALPPRGTSAFVYVDQKTGKPTLFDHVNITVRGTALVSQGEANGGYKVHLHKDQALQGMTTVNLIFEGNERFILSEALTYELFRRAGNPVSMADFIRVWADGRLVGYHLLMEQPNRSFLRRNKLRDDGNLYKVNWFGGGIAGTHEKKTNAQGNHEDITSIVSKLQQTRGEEQWKIIQDNFDVPAFVNYFAINHLVSDWDGSFNNYFVYHDFNGTKKWTIYPWDRDKTWGVYDRLPEGQLFIDMALTNGMEGDRKPPSDGKGGSADDTAAWWRSGGVFSRPLLANPQFRRLFLARTKELLEKVFTDEAFFPVIDAMADRLQEEVQIRSQATKGNPQAGADRLRANVQSLKSYLVSRRQFLLRQPELQGL